MKISIIIPVYNSEEVVKRAVRSIDTKYDHEIICINDGSTDHTLQTLEELQRENKHIKIINQENKGAAASRNVGLSQMTGDVYMFLDADDEFLPSRIDLMARRYEANDDVEIVVGQTGRDYHGEWRTFPTHEEIKKDEVVNLTQCPAILQSIGPRDKMFSSRFKNLRFDEDIVFCEEHTYMAHAFNQARDIQLLPDIIAGYNMRENSITAQSVERFFSYMRDAYKVRQRVMDYLRMPNVQEYYSYRMDELIVSYMLQAYVTAKPKVTQDLLDVVIQYIEGMQKTHYDGNALFRIVKVMEGGAIGWTPAFYRQWREALNKVGIGRPNYIAFHLQLVPKIGVFRGRNALKKALKR
ncbi:glycosyltransferase family 2 protein [Staphylococcus carnosus]|uniref:Putative glycosyltransferase TagX n=1 Tax=Staphylococcus carnosus TaxID=1281 RepID=A0AAJ0JPP8_STACA|nr:glycosyltransferase family A protein [Staphylococcus carnosus]KKB25133.1 teichoic acid biosynthesis protein [Staphylococcus carnosus]KOR14263.1 teichoic acid biosynthesis protein [Staphylococcus carnosus]POA06878.1 glycosyltransferase family 2 protein [Staphylococcus carnosus]QQS86017.1 glycosyltransferase family 2 protein [Staphylococcus carnosus]QRQ05952.1 glycosyltransferase family 2 protein [Staphylococcus carnosus]